MPVFPVAPASPVTPTAPVPASPRPVAAGPAPAAAPGDRVTAATATGAVPATGALAQTARWGDEAVADAFGAWLPERWAQWKSASEEADCKTAAARMMEDFRQHYRETTGITLPDPFRGRSNWSLSTAETTRGLTATVPSRGPLRPEYRRHRGEGLIDGPNHRLLGFAAHNVAISATTPITRRDGQPLVTRYQGRGNYPRHNLRINQDLLRPGDVIFQQHTHPNDTRWDHTMTVVGVEKDDQGRTQRLTVAIGSFDDLKDADSATPAMGPINLYAYEQVIEFQDGEISDARVTWQTDESLHPIGANETPQQRIRRAQVILGAQQRQTAVHRWGRADQ